MTDLIDGDVERLATGFAFTEGPVWIAERGWLLFTDIPNDAILVWDGEAARTWLAPAHFPIGLARGRDGRVLICEHSRRSLSARTLDDAGGPGPREVLASGHGGAVLNSTNDVIAASDGSVLFTDPPFGVRTLEGALHGYQQAQELPGAWVFRAGDDPAAAEPVIRDVYRPNGLCLSPDERTLYVSDSSERHHKVIAFEVGAGWSFGPGRDFAVMPEGVPDGMRVDADGNLWVAGGDGVHVWSAMGETVGHVPVPEMVTNLEFGGADGRDVFITATTSLYRLRAARPGGRA